jgi:FkbM family methyltransferase
MGSISTNTNPSMSAFIAQHTDLFITDPMIIADVGARDGYNVEWTPLGAGMKVFCFEPDAAECARLNAEGAANVRYIPSAIGRKPGRQTLYEANLSYSTGLYPSRMDFFDRMLNGENGRVIGQREIIVDTLDNAMASENLFMLNFLKLDAEGAELDILLGATKILHDPRLFGILAEIRFHPESNSSPPFWQIDQFLQAQGFRLFDISSNKWSRRALPYLGTQDYILSDGRRFYAYTTQGQVVDGDALYFRDLLLPQNRALAESLSAKDLLKLAALYEIYHHNDAAAELIQAFRGKIGEIIDCDVLLDHLTPDFFGAKLSYPAYLEVYFHPETRFAAPPAPAPASVASAPAEDISAATSLVAAQAATEIALLRSELNQMRASTSWRVTRPLRALRRLLRGA